MDQRQSEVHTPIELDNPRGSANNALSFTERIPEISLAHFQRFGPFFLHERYYQGGEHLAWSNRESRNACNHALYGQMTAGWGRLCGIFSAQGRQSILHWGYFPPGKDKNTLLTVIQVIRYYTNVMKQRVILFLCGLKSQNQDKGKTNKKTPGSYSKADLDSIYERAVRI